jgi:hypothetical protein
MKAKVHILLLSFLVFSPALCHVQSAEEQLQIVEDGKTPYRIVIGPGASPTEDFAAYELQGYIMQMSGVFLPMDRGNVPVAGKRILVGRAAVAKLRLKADESYLGPDGFAIKTIDDRILLVGGSPRGTLYSVYTFLEMLGCRWFAPGIIGEVIPQLSNIEIAPIDHTERPDIPYRGFINYIPTASARWIDWMAKNKMNYLMVPQPDYADFKQISGGELERRGMEAGVSFAIEDSQPTADQILEFIAGNPEVRIIEVRAGHSENSISSSQLIEIEEAMHQNHPDRIAFLAVRGIETPPASRDILLSFDPGSRCYRHSLGDQQCEINSQVRSTFENQLELWGRAHIHEYYMGTYSQNSLPFPILHTIASDLQYFKTLNRVEAVISQCEPGNWGTYGLNYYVFARTAWKAGVDLGIIVDDYCEKYYGSASEPMKRYFARLEDSMKAMEHFSFIDPPQLILKLFDEKTLEALGTEIQNAENLANDAMSFDRIRKTQLALEHTKLLWHTLDHYFKALQSQEAGEIKKAESHFQNAVEMGEKLVAFLFRNLDEGVFIIPEGYIFDYLEALIADARDRKELLDAQ